MTTKKSHTERRTPEGHASGRTKCGRAMRSVDAWGDAETCDACARVERRERDERVRKAVRS
jgi:hypothetical protein